MRGTGGPWASLVAQMVKRLPARWEIWVQSLGCEDPLEKEIWQPAPVHFLFYLSIEHAACGISVLQPGIEPTSPPSGVLTSGPAGRPHSSTLAWRIPWMERPSPSPSSSVQLLGAGCVLQLSRVAASAAESPRRRAELVLLEEQGRV